MRKLIFALIIVFTTVYAFSQNDSYYWYNDKKVEIIPCPYKKFLIVSEDISNLNELERVLDNDSIGINVFKETNILQRLINNDTTLTEKKCAIIESDHTIDERKILNNSNVDYLETFYYQDSIVIGFSHMLYVYLKNVQDTAILDSMAYNRNMKVIGNNRFMPLLYTLECTNQSKGNSISMANEFYESGQFAFAQPSPLIEFDLNSINDPLFKSQWALDNTNEHTNIDINACKAWQITKGAQDVIIAVIDNGVKPDHEDIVDAINENLCFNTDDNSNNCNYFSYSSYLANYDHGTSCAGIIAGQHNSIGISGIAPECQIMSVFVDFTWPIDILQRLADGINYAWQNGADIMSSSWGSFDYTWSILDLAITNARNNGRYGKGSVLVFASGNIHNEYVASPGDSPALMSVGAIDSCGYRCVSNITDSTPMCGSIWSGSGESNYGLGLSVVAPGDDVVTTSYGPSEVDQYRNNFAGTSAATPHVASVAALMLSVDTSLTYFEVKNIIEQTAQKIRGNHYSYTNEDNGLWNEELGYGMVDAYAALHEILDCHDDVFIESTDNITWSDETNLCENLTVEGVLTINAPVHIYSDLPEITIQNGGHLIFDTGSELYYRDVENFAGNINVEAGSTLEFKNGSDIVLAENGKIMVNHDSNNSGELVFNSGASLTLLDDNTNLEIAGDLNIASNANFTYTGDGYIKFSNPGGDATNNIFCGTGASIVLQGSGQNDKIMEVQQSSVRFPAELSSLELRDGKIEMGAYARLLNEVVSGNEDYPIILDNIKITSDDDTCNNHRSYFFWGQPNITVNDCVFEYGQYGLYNYTYWGSPLTVTNSTFRYNQTGLYMYDKGLTLTNCSFDYNTQVGLHADNMSFVSQLTSCKFKNNSEGINYQGSASADLSLIMCEVLYSDNDGIVTTGGFDLDLDCTWVRNNQDGISANQGTFVNIANNARNDLSNNVNAICLDYGSLSANDGYNNLASNNYAVIGETPILCLLGFPSFLSAEHNTWDSNNFPPTYLQNHELRVMNCNRKPVSIIDTNPDDIFCYHIIFIGRDLESGAESGNNNDILLSGESSDESLSSQVDNLELSMQEANTAAACQQLISESITLMENVYGIETAEAYYQSNRIWSNIHNIIDKHYKIISRDNENLSFNQSVDQVMQLNAQLMLDADAIAYYEYALDNALLERLRGNFDESLFLLDNLIPELEGMDKEIAYVNRWICHIEAERAAALRNITPEEFLDAVATCNTDYENSLESLSDNLETDENAEETSTAPEIHIVPNPNNGFFTLEISDCTEGSSVRISNVYSQPVFTQTFTESGTQTVQITGLSQGHYTVYYLENDAVISSENIVVE